MKEFADFLGGQVPYDALDAPDLEVLARAVEVEYVAAGDTVVSAGEPVLDHLWVVRTGAVEVVDRGRVVDQMGVGDTFGHISVLTGLPPALSIRAAEDSLCLRLPDPRTVLAHPERLGFSHFGTLVSRERLTGEGVARQDSRPVRELARPVLWCEAGDTVAEVAAAMGRDSMTSCALVRSPDGTGIVTDRDFRERVATGEVPVHAPVAALATFPALTIDGSVPRAQAFLRMLEIGVHHLVVADRTRRPVGVLRAVDLASAEVRNPLLIRSAAESAASVDDLARALALLPATVAELRALGVPSTHLGTVIAAVVDVAVRKVVGLREPVAGLPEVSWLVLGSTGRREPLPGSDVDTALVWRGPDRERGQGPAAGTEVDDALVARLRAEAAGVLDDLERCGLRRCPDGANADTPLFSRSAPTWSAARERWAADPSTPGALLMTGLVTDARPVLSVALGRSLGDSMRSVRREKVLLNAFLRECLTVRPPTGFVRELVIDHSGRRRGQLDLKRHGLVPIAAIARWTALAGGDTRGTTPERLAAAADRGLLTADEAESLTGAFGLVHGLAMDRAVAAVVEGRPTQGDPGSGRRPSAVLAASELDSLTRRYLREAFHAVADVQRHLSSDGLARLMR